MYRRNRLSLGLRALLLACATGAVLNAMAFDSWDLGSVTLANSGLNPGENGASNGNPWDTSWTGGGYYNYAGGFQWNTNTIQTMCGSMFQEFNPGSPFATTEYWLNNAVNGIDSVHVKIGDGQNIQLPPGDTNSPGDETNTKFLKAAELFGHEFNAVETGYSGVQLQEESAALQLAIWHALYGGTGTGNGTLAVAAAGNTLSDYNNFVTYLTGGVNAGQLSASDLSHVVWYDYTGTGNGQSQFGWTLNPPPVPTPEPVTIALGVAGLAIAARRRFVSK